MRRIHDNVGTDAREALMERRERIDLLRSRASLLTGRDRLLMEMYLENGNTFRQMARLAGVNESSIAKRINKVTKRLLDGEYITCLRNRERLGVAELSMAKDYFLDGLSIRRIAEKRGCTFYQVRKTLLKIQAIVRLVQQSA